MLVLKPQCRRAEISEAAEIAQLLRASIIQLCVADHENREEPLQAWLANKTAANVETWICNPANIMLVATIERHIGGVGCLRVDGHVILNYVSPLYRFKGVSKAVLEALEQHGRALGLLSLELESTRTAHRFYQGTGFTDTGAPETKHGIPAYPMEKSLV